MAKQTVKGFIASAGGDLGCCKIESLVTVDERGQMVLPKDIREKANIRPGDKLAVVSWQQGKSVCCLTLIKADEFGQLLKNLLGPMFKQISEE